LTGIAKQCLIFWSGKTCPAFPSPSDLTGDNSMKIIGNKQIPNIIVYFALYTIIFGVSIWLLSFHQESPTNWLLYFMMLVAALAGLVKFALQRRRKPQQSV
jgi:hypothetical protein